MVWCFFHPHLVAILCSWFEIEPENEPFWKVNHLNQTFIFGFKMLFFRGVSIYLKFQSQIFGIWTKHRQICKSRLLREQQDARGTSQHSAFPQKHHAGLQVAQTNEDGCALPGSKEKQRNPKIFFEKTAPSSLKLKRFGILLLNLAGNIEHVIYPPWN